MKTRNAGDRVEKKKLQTKEFSRGECSCTTTCTPHDQHCKQRILTYSAHFVGPSFPAALAKQRWPHRYSTPPPKQGTKAKKLDTNIEEENLSTPKCKAHYSTAEVDGHMYELNDYVTINANAAHEYTGRIREFFKTTDKASWLEIQWMFRPEDTVLGKEEAQKHDAKRLFYSDETDVVPLECITSKITVLHTQPQLLLPSQPEHVVRCDYYYDMGYAYDYSTFYTISAANKTGGVHTSQSSSIVSNPTSSHRMTRSQSHASPVDAASKMPKEQVVNHSITRSYKFEQPEVPKMVPQSANSSSYSFIVDAASESKQAMMANSILNGKSDRELNLLDMYSGCGGMSTGLCTGASLSNIKLETVSSGRR